MANKSQDVSAKNLELLQEVTQVEQMVREMEQPGKQLPTALDKIKNVAKMNSYTNTTYNQIKRLLLKNLSNIGFNLEILFGIVFHQY